MPGSRFRGISGASGGGTNDSSSDFPLVQIRRIDSGLSMFIRPDPDGAFSANGWESEPIPLFSGHVLVTVFVNGIPSESMIMLSEIWALRDSNGDGLNDAAEFGGGLFGLDAIVAQPELVAAFQSTASDAGFYDQTEHDANGAAERTAGQNEVIDDPYNFPRLVSKIQELNVGARLIGYDPGTGKYTLTITLMRGLNLPATSFAAFPMSEATTTINPQGELEFESLEAAEFFLLKAQ